MSENGKELKKVDRFGRVLLPYSMRKNIGIKSGDVVEVIREDNTITIIPDVACMLCGSLKNIGLINDIPFCEECRKRQNQNRVED